MEARDENPQIYTVYMDRSKALDIVDHSSALHTIHQQGMNGSLWSIISNACSDITSRVKWNGSIN
jgi:hypothetical protein